MRRVVVVLLVGAFVLTGCSRRDALPTLDVPAAAAAASEAIVDGELTDGTWPDVAAFVVESADAGQGTVVNVLASWCAPCEQELPLLLAASATTPDIRWLGVASLDRRQDAEPFLARMEVTWPVVLDRQATVHEALQRLAMPTTAFFDASGTLVDIVVGPLTEERLTKALARVRG